LKQLATPQWAHLFLSLSLTPASITGDDTAFHPFESASQLSRILAARICRQLLPLVSPEAMATAQLPVSVQLANKAQQASALGARADLPAAPPMLSRQSSIMFIRGVLSRVFEDIGQFSWPWPSVRPSKQGAAKANAAVLANALADSGMDYTEFRNLYHVNSVDARYELVDLFRVLLKGGASVPQVEWSEGANQLISNALKPLKAGAALVGTTAVTQLQDVQFAQIKDALAALSILGGQIEPVREGGRVALEVAGAEQCTFLCFSLAICDFANSNRSLIRR
jgi:hypothetical protein